MEITEVRVKLAGSSEKLRAFCSVTFDDSLAIRDMKIIEITKGLFVAMPSRKLTRRCTACRTKNHLRANYCSECGRQLSEVVLPKSQSGRLRLHADIAFPTNSAARERLHEAVILAYEDEIRRSKLPGYRPPRGVLDDDDEHETWSGHDDSPPPPREPTDGEQPGFGAGIT